MRLRLAALIALTISAAAAAQGPDPVRPAERLLEIDVVALDRNGQPVDDLKRDDVEVWIGGLRIPIETFTAVRPADGERARRSIVLLLDDITLSPVGVSRTKEIARRFVNRISAGDQMAIVALNGDVTKTSDDRRELMRSIDAYNVRASTFMRPDDLGAHVLTTITAISRQVSEASARRRTIVAIGAGWLLDTPIPPPSAGRELTKEWTEALRAMAAANVTLYVIDPGGVGTSPVLGGGSGFARDTGGYAFINTNDYYGAVDRIMREIAFYYIIGVTDPPVFRSADLRELDVRAKRRGLSVRARRAIRGRP